MQRYLAEALPLGKDAVSTALDRAGRGRAPTSACSSVCSCTGYVTPGLDILLARDLGLPPRRPPGLRRPHGLLRGAARPRRGRRLRGAAPAARRCCSAWNCPACTCNRPLWTPSRWSRTRCSPTPGAKTLQFSIAVPQKWDGKFNKKKLKDNGVAISFTCEYEKFEVTLGSVSSIEVKSLNGKFEFDCKPSNLFLELKLESHYDVFICYVGLPDMGSPPDIEINGPIEDQQAIRSFLYYLRSSICPYYPNPVAPLGLSSSTYNGHVFWDADIWIFPALAFLDPDRASSISNYRIKMAKAAEQNSRKGGLGSNLKLSLKASKL